MSGFGEVQGAPGGQPLGFHMSPLSPPSVPCGPSSLQMVAIAIDGFGHGNGGAEGVCCCVMLFVFSPACHCSSVWHGLRSQIISQGIMLYSTL